MAVRSAFAVGVTGWLLLALLAAASGATGLGCVGTVHSGSAGGDDGGGAGDGAAGADGGPATEGGAVALPCPSVGIGVSLFRAACASGQPAASWSPVRRISRVEYNNMARDLLGDTTHPADQFVAESPLAVGVNFQANTCTGVGSTDTYVPQQYLQAAEALADKAVADANALNS